MISKLKGLLEDKTAGALVLMTGGVGYEVFIPLSTFYELPDPGAEISLFIKTVVREDALELFGFLTQSEKDAFLLLNGVSKIGPRLALNILSGIDPADLVAAVSHKDLARLTGIPGIGLKTAERMVLELKDKIGRLAALAGPPSGPAKVPADGSGDALGRDVISALVNLGYGRAEAEKAVATVRARVSGPDAHDLAGLIRLSLRHLNKA